MGTEISITTDSTKKKHKVRKGWSNTCSYGCTKPTAYAHTGMEMFIFLLKNIYLPKVIRSEF